MISKFAKLALPFAIALLVAPTCLAQSGTPQNSLAVPASIPPPPAAQSLPRPDFTSRERSAAPIRSPIPQCFDYTPPFKFNGKIQKLTLELK
jgi:hypothetical protein